MGDLPSVTMYLLLIGRLFGNPCVPVRIQQARFYVEQLADGAGIAAVEEHQACGDKYGRVWRVGFMPLCEHGGNLVRRRRAYYTGDTLGQFALGLASAKSGEFANFLGCWRSVVGTDLACNPKFLKFCVSGGHDRMESFSHGNGIAQNRKERKMVTGKLKIDGDMPGLGVVMLHRSFVSLAWENRKWIRLWKNDKVMCEWYKGRHAAYRLAALFLRDTYINSRRIVGKI